jgi:DNA (cytosine-5)-methyltransferase 1
VEFDTLGEDTALASISIFSGGGIGDLGIEHGCDIPVISACEIVPSRAALLRSNFPSTRVFQSDIWECKGEIIQHALDALDGKRPWLVVLSPPCQGMSSNGAGRISAAISAGTRPPHDERNRLVIPGLVVLEQLQPDWFILENVKRMENTVITNEHGEPENILDLIGRRLHPLGYTIRSAIIDLQKLGVPHNRQRLITIGCKLDSVVGSVPPVASSSLFHPSPTPLHPSCESDLVTLREAIGHLPPLDAKSKLVDPDDEWHQVPRWNDDHYFWMENTPEGATAFDNLACVECEQVETDQTAVSCGACGAPLPRPQKNGDGGIPRLIKGFRTSYRRLRWDAPGSTLTMNSGVISSDMKGHPDQNRVLSLKEIRILATIDNRPGVEYPWHEKYQFTNKPGGQPEPINARLVRQVIGESIPPLAMSTIVSHIMRVDGRIDMTGRYTGGATSILLPDQDQT